MYETLVLIDAASDIRMDEVQKAISIKYRNSRSSKPLISASEELIQLSWGEFKLNIHYSADVLEESAEIAAIYGKAHHAQVAIAACEKRLEIAGSDDSSMQYFNDFCLVLEAIESCGICYTFDPKDEILL